MLNENIYSYNSFVLNHNVEQVLATVAEMTVYRICELASADDYNSLQYRNRFSDLRCKYMKRSAQNHFAKLHKSLHYIDNL